MSALDIYDLAPMSGWCLLVSAAILMFLMARAQFAANHHKTCVYAPAAANTPLYTLDLEIGQFIRTNVGF